MIKFNRKQIEKKLKGGLRKDKMKSKKGFFGLAAFIFWVFVIGAIHGVYLAVKYFWR